MVAVTDRRCVERRVGRLVAIGALAAVLAGGVVRAEAQVPLVLAETPDEQEGSLSDVGPSNTDVAPRPVAPVDTAPLTIPGGQPSVQDLMRRIDQLEGRQQTFNRRLETGDLGQMIRRATANPVLDERSGSLSSVGPSNTDVRPSEDDAYGVGYNAGFYIRPDDPEKDPYEIVMNGRMQFRYVGFSRERESWVNAAGDTIPLYNRSDFEIERGRLSFKGFMLDKDLQYFINFDFDTDDRDQVIIHDFWVNNRFSDALDVYVGKAFVPGSREWINGSTTTRFSDRTLACTFFRPDRTVGVWAEGEYLEDRFYRVMVGDGFNTNGLQPLPGQIDNNFVYSGTTWWDIGGEYGRGYSDLEDHQVVATEIGTSFTYARQEGPGPIDQPRIEQNFVRLADGTRLTTPGALLPGVTVNEFDIMLFAVDWAWKYRGWSFDMEYYFRQIDRIRGVDLTNPGNPVPVSFGSDVIYNHGFGMEAGYFLIPKRFEVNFRTSQIYGDYGPSREYAGGVNWFRNGTHNYKWTFDATQIYGSAAENSGPNYVAGETGVLFRLQLQAAF